MTETVPTEEQPEVVRPRPCSPVRDASERSDREVALLLKVRECEGLTDEERDLLVDIANTMQWDDAIHIAAPWELRSSLCGNWGRNLVALGDERPDGMAGCWTCLMAADWFDAQKLVPK